MQVKNVWDVYSDNLFLFCDLSVCESYWNVFIVYFVRYVWFFGC